MTTKQEPQASPKITQTRILLAVSVLVAALLTGYVLFRPPSPETIRDRALAALQNKDAEALCRLADPQELSQTHLTPQKVTLLLQDTLWQQTHPQLIRYKLFADKPADKRSWLIDWHSDTPQKGLFGLSVVDDPDIGWKLVLSDVLVSGYYWKAGREGGRQFRERLQQMDIVSGRQQDGSYQSYLPENKNMND